MEFNPLFWIFHSSSGLIYDLAFIADASARKGLVKGTYISWLYLWASCIAFGSGGGIISSFLLPHPNVCGFSDLFLAASTLVWFVFMRSRYLCEQWTSSSGLIHYIGLIGTTIGWARCVCAATEAALLQCNNVVFVLLLGTIGGCGGGILEAVEAAVYRDSKADPVPAIQVSLFMSSIYLLSRTAMTDILYVHPVVMKITLGCLLVPHVLFCECYRIPINSVFAAMHYTLNVILGNLQDAPQQRKKR